MIDLTPVEGTSFDFDLFFDRFASLDNATRTDWIDYFTEKATCVGLCDPDKQGWRVVLRKYATTQQRRQSTLRNTTKSTSSSTMDIRCLETRHES